MRTRSTGWLRAGLVAYLGVTLLVGAWAAGWPRAFYDDFPWPRHPWVAALPAYNEHLVRDFGGRGHPAKGGDAGMSLQAVTAPLRLVYRPIWQPRYARHDHWEPSTPLLQGRGDREHPAAGCALLHPN